MVSNRFPVFLVAPGEPLKCLFVYKAPEVQRQVKIKPYGLQHSAPLFTTFLTFFTTPNMFSLSYLFVFASLLFSSALSVPTPEVGIESRAATVTSAPRFVIYSDKWVSGETGPPKASTIKV